MAKTKYEAVVIFTLKDGAEAVPAMVERFKNLIEQHAALESVDEWGPRKFAYEIDKQTEGYYVIYNFESEPEFPAEFSRVVNITDYAIRTQIVKKEG